MSLKLISVNIERSIHLDRVENFVRTSSPDVLCIQELAEKDIPRILAMYPGATYEYAPMLRHIKFPNQPVVGVGIFSRLPVRAKHTDYYYGSAENLPEHDETPDRGDTMNCAIVFLESELDGQVYKIGTTHFTWSAEGQATEAQRTNMRAMLEVLDSAGDCVVTGDFNAPRGREVFDTLAARYKDNIPSRYTSSIDGSLHRAGPLELMVDGLFSTPMYTVSDVELHTGVSDHCAVTALVSKTS